MKVLLSAFIGSHNLGDEAIADIVINKLEFVPKFEQITVLSIRPSVTEKMVTASRTKVVKAGFGNFFKQLRRSDALVLGGGGIIQDESSVVNMLYYYFQSLVANMFMKKPVYLIFVGVGPVKSKLGSFALRKMSKRITFSLVRDVESRDLLVKHGFKSDSIEVSYDIVFNMRSENKDKPVVAGDYVLFCPRDWFFTRTYIPTKYALKLAKRDQSSEFYKYRNSLLDFVTYTLEATELKIVGVAFFYTQDKDLIEWIKARVPEQHRERLIVMDEMSPRDYVNLAKDSKAVVGVRLHSLILAAVAMVPVVPLVYSSKVKSLVKYMSWQDYTTYLTSSSFSAKEVFNKLQMAFDSSKATTYRSNLDNIRKTNDNAFVSLAKKISSR